jgi:signal transduction histidine kinase
MLGLILIALIVYAIHQKRRHQRMWWDKIDWNSYTGRLNSESWRKAWDPKTWGQAGEKAEQYARDFESKISRRFEEKAARHERRLRRSFDRQTRKYGGVDSADPAFDTPRPQFQNDSERSAYDRARRRAAAEAGFYVHLMWYGLVMGFLMLINNLTSPGFQWWLFPAAGWGFGIASHFIAVFGWRWVQQRVFEPAIAREVKREVMQEKEHLATEKQASLDELTATFAHEIRNPIAAAKSLVQQMGEDPQSNENVEYAKVALDELARVERSVSHLLKYAKEEDYRFENTNLAGVLDGALTQLRAKIETANVTVSRAYLGGPTVRADADKLRQVFSNVIDNAIDAMDSRTGDRKLELAIHNNGNGAATVIIRDNGCGIAPDKLGKIFNPFYTSKANGTGLGLGVAKKVVDAHRGTILVASTPGVGTEFRIEIPLADAMREDAGASEPANVADNQASSPATGVNGTAPNAMAASATGASYESRLRN